MTITLQTPSGNQVEIETLGRDTIMHETDLQVRVPAADFTGTSAARHIAGDIIHCDHNSVGVQVDAESAVRLAEFAAGIRRADAASPEAQARKLRFDRDTLASRIAGLVEDQQTDSNRAWEAGDEAGTFRIRDSYDTRINQARAALREFDAAHPEV